MHSQPSINNILERRNRASRRKTNQSAIKIPIGNHDKGCNPGSASCEAGFCAQFRYHAIVKWFFRSERATLTRERSQMCTIDFPSWYALCVRTNWERLAGQALDNMQVHNFVPTYRVHSHNDCRAAWTERALFPGYLFCKIDLARGPRLYTIPGVRSIVGSGRLPISISDNEIQSIRQLIDSQLQLSPHPFLIVGQEVLVTHGPLRGIIGTYKSTDTSGHLLVSFPLLKRCIDVSVERSWVAPISSDLAHSDQAPHNHRYKT
jgi:transcription antitermination factor NusG